MNSSATIILQSALLALFSQIAIAADACQPHIEYVTVTLPAGATLPTEAVAAQAIPDAKLVNVPESGQNTTHTCGPVAAPNIDTSDPINIIPSQNVSIYYGSSPNSDSTMNSTLNSTSHPGLVNVTLSMDYPTVILEYIEAITNVDCSDDGVEITFGKNATFSTALKQWSAQDNFVMITNHLGDCDTEFERGFFLSEGVTSDPFSRKITVQASKKQLDSLAHTGEFTFSSLPAARLSKRLTVNPSASYSISKGLSDDTVLFKHDPYLSVVANEASFTTAVTFSGYLKYNFWGFKLEQLYFDLDTGFSADVEITAAVTAPYSTSFVYAPDELSYSLVSVPGLVEIGPGIDFGVGVDVTASGAVSATIGAGISIAKGNVHLDLLNDKKSTSSGWTPTYNSYANITEKAEIQINPTASVSVELAFKLLGGLVDLSSGIKASPGFTNHFTITGTQSFDGKTVSLPTNTEGACNQGVELKSDFNFDLTAFATKWWSKSLYSTKVPLLDKCYSFL